MNIISRSHRMIPNVTQYDHKLRVEKKKKDWVKIRLNSVYHS